MKNHPRSSESFLKLPAGDTYCSNNNSCPDIPMELVSKEEMDLIDAAFAAAHPSLTSPSAPATPETSSPPQFRRDPKSSQSLTLLSEMEVVSEEEMGLIEASLAAIPPSLTSSPASATPETSSSRQFRRNSKSSRSITLLSKKTEMEVVSEEEMGLIEASLAAIPLSLTSSPAPATPETSSSRQFRRNSKSSQSNTMLSEKIEMVVVSEKDMGLIDAAIAVTPSSLISSVPPAASSPSLFQRKANSIQSITPLSRRRLSFEAESDIEDSFSLGRNQKKIRVAESFLRRFRSKTGLFVSDITGTEWCEKQMQFILLLGSRKITEAMKIGRARHAKLEEEVVKKVEVPINSAEDQWAVRLMDFIIRAYQLLTKGLTRELPLIGLVQGVWMVGVIDEVRMPGIESDRNPRFIDTKTRVTDTLPAEPQKRKGRLQLMCYKYLWDNLVTDEFPSDRFFNFFSLNPYSILSEEIRENFAKSGFPAKTLDDIVRYYRHKCSMLLPAHDQLLVRYELQKDKRVIDEDLFAYDSDWIKSQIHCCLEFWLGERQANCTPPEERWKCRFCQYDIVCSTNTNPDNASSLTKANQDSSLT